MWLTLLATSTPTDSIGPALQQIGIGTLVASPAWFTAWLFWKRYLAKDQELKECQQQRVKDLQDAQLLRVKDLQESQVRERELTDRAIPVLAESVKLSAVLPERITQSIREASSAQGAQRLEELMHRFEGIVNQFPRDSGR